LTVPPPKILISTVGSFGDLFPFLALGLALQREGFDVAVATSGVYREFVEREGLDFVAARPDLDDVTEKLGLDLGGLARQMSRDDGFLFQRIIFPFLRESYDDIGAAAASGAVAIVAHSIAFAAHAAAEKLDLPLFVAHLSPVLHYLPQQPPLGMGLPFVAAPRSKLALGYNRVALACAAEVAHLWAAPLRQFRRELGLPRRAPFSFFRGVPSPFHSLGLHSPAFLGDQGGDLVAGHTFFDRGPPRAKEETRALAAFLDEGEAPVVFTLGSFVVRDRAAHHRSCIEAAQRLGQRAVLLASDEDAALLRAQAPPSIHVAGYAPHGELFPRAKIVVHHGGIGTSGQALRAGKPQLVTPFLGDQADNAARLARLGVARVLPAKALTVETLTRELRDLLARRDYASRAEALGARVAREDGAQAAARHIAETLRA